MTNELHNKTKREILHGEFLAGQGAGRIWNWESPAGKLRWKRRACMLVSGITPDMQVLELGCGTGYLTHELAKTGAAVYAIDISSDLLDLAQSSVKSSNVTFSVADAHSLDFPDAHFDRVTGSSILHHLDVETALLECRRVLKAGGGISFTEPNMLNPQIAIQKNIPFIKKLMGDSPDETAFFHWSFRKKLENAGFSRISVQPFDFLHPWTPKLLIGIVNPVCSLAENIPLVSEFAGSLHIKAVKA